MPSTMNNPTSNITREQFLDYFRSDEGYAELTDDDCRELFAGALKGSGDFTFAFLQEVLGDYNISLEEVCLNSLNHRELINFARSLLSKVANDLYNREHN